MARGRNYYDPILQVPSAVEGAPDLSRIELFPAGAESLGRLPQDQGKWIGRRINPDGSVAEEAPGDFDHDKALTQAQDLWPGLTVFELNAELEDSTWDGVGPSPRLWAHANESATVTPIPLAVPEPPAMRLEDLSLEPTPMRGIHAAEPGVYLLLGDVCDFLEMWAVGKEQEKNPSAALALREAADALKDIG